MESSLSVDILDGHPKCDRPPKKKERAICTWCGTKALGNNFAVHRCVVPKPPYMSYKMVGLQSVASFFKSAKPTENHESLPSEVAQDEKDLQLENEFKSQSNETENRVKLVSFSLFYRYICNVILWHTVVSSVTSTSTGLCGDP